MSAWEETNPHHHPVDPDPTWRESAVCRGMGPDLFFPSRGELVEEAKAVCTQCSVQVECLEYALTLPVRTPGVWAGTSERERETIRRGRPA